jgi:hypothetical protein
MKNFILTLFLISSSCLAQYVRLDFSLKNAQEQLISNAQVYILTQPANPQSFSPQATIYGSSTGSGTAVCGGSAGALTQPILTNGFGQACAYAPPGIYTIVYNSLYAGIQTFQDQTIESSSVTTDGTQYCLTADGAGESARRFTHICSDSTNNNLSIPGSVTANAATLGQVNTIYNANACSAASPPSWCSGSDIGAWANAAFTQCSGKCTVYIPAEVYSQSTTINFPVNNNGTAALWCDAGATLNYLGSSYAIAALGTTGNNTLANVSIHGGCKIVGTSSGLGGIHLRSLGGVNIQNLIVLNFTNGDGWFNEGANTVSCHSCYFNGNKNGIHNVGVIVSSVNYAANAVRFYGGAVASNSGWGAFEDGSQAGAVGNNENNLYNGVVFETNGTNANPSTSGNLFVQSCDVCNISNSYFEYGPTQTLTNQVLLGDNTHAVNDLTMFDNWYGSASSITNTINCVNCIRPTFQVNTEEGTPTNFFNAGALSQGIWFGPNVGFSATNYVTGTGSFMFFSKSGSLVSAKNTLDDGRGNTVIFGNASVGNGSKIVYRCTIAGNLPVGALTITSSNCGASTDSGLRIK